MMIYYVEDDPNIRNLATYALEQAGLKTQGFSAAEELYAACQIELPELFLLDIMLPHEDGISILRHLRDQQATKDIPVMMLTAKGTEFDVVTGLDSGADDYLAKPFGMMELVSRVNALLRRSGKESGQDGYEVLRAEGLALTPSKRSVTVNDEPVTLTFKEFELLRMLLENRGLVLSREQLLELVWGWSYSGNTRTVDVHIQTLRQKLGEAGSLIETIRGVGYRVKESLR